jgi:DNA-binding transcriptional LysR family regulator
VSGEELDWDDLRYFLRAVQAKTLAGAARAAGVEHTTIGRRLTALERALGAALVIRRPDGLALTALGEQVVPLVEEMERTVRAVRDVVAGQQARVRLAVPSGFTRLFADGLSRLRETHPAICLELVSSARPVDLEKGEADLAIRIGPITDEDLVQRKLGTAGTSLYASQAYLARHPAPIDLDDLGGHELIGFDASLAMLPAARWLEERARNAVVVLRSREMTDVIAAAVSGVGLAMVPCVLGDREPALVRLTPEVLVSRDVSLVYRRESRIAEPVRAVIEFVVEMMTELAEPISGEARLEARSGDQR